MRGLHAVCLLALSSTGCGVGTARFPTSDASAEREDTRQAPGVALDLQSRLPEPLTRADLSPGVVVLSAPRDLQNAADLVAAFFRAVTLESGEALEHLFSADAQLESNAGRHPARGAWRSRFTQFDYGALRATPLYRPSDVETYRSNDRPVLAFSRRLPPMQPDDVFIRVHLDVTHVNKTRLFADEIGFLLRASGAGYRIASLSEDFQLP